MPAPTTVLLDIEGTISSLPHVVTTHYPYTRRHIAAYLAAHADDPPVRAALEETRALAGPGVAPLDALIRWIDEDAKAPPLKFLQGLVWISGYETGELVGHIYPDALESLRRWREAGVPRHIFSSGSVQCQTQFFQHCPEGDLRSLFDRHFDTGVGAKVEPKSYVAHRRRARPADPRHPVLQRQSARTRSRIVRRRPGRPGASGRRRGGRPLPGDRKLSRFRRQPSCVTRAPADPRAAEQGPRPARPRRARGRISGRRARGRGGGASGSSGRPAAEPTIVEISI